MTVVRKKRLKIKKKNFTIFIICILLILTSITYSIKLITKSLNKKETEITNKEKINKKEFSKITYYDKKNQNRYEKYQKLKPNLSIEKIVTEVNIGLDNDYYTNDAKTINLNTEYILVNKYNYLTKDYVPDNLETISNQYALENMQMVNYAKEAFEKMAKEAKKENLSIIAMSTYRSYEYQISLYDKYVKIDGKEKADTYSGRPGYSEHQTGLAVDVYNGKESYTNFEITEEFKWMEKNAYKYGFILRFPKNKTKETGYDYESWHYRYVGKKIAKYIQENNISYEEYYVKYIENKKD